MKRKIDAMYEKYGIAEGKKCRDCPNYFRYRYYKRSYGKCKAYGDSHASTTDWSGRNNACGLFGEDPGTRNPLFDVLKHEKREMPEPPAEGQIGFDEIEEKR